LAKPSYRPSPINLGANTDPYQPIERRYKITRQLLEVLLEHRHPCTIVTKNALIERDIDLLAQLAKDNLVYAFVSVTSLDNKLASKLEPRASAPHRRLAAIKTLHDAGIPVGVLVAPIIPMLTDRWMEQILERGAANGARMAGYTVLRLPYELKQLVREWLFATRMRGEGEFAELIKQRFALATKKLGLARNRDIALQSGLFMPPTPKGPQGELF